MTSTITSAGQTTVPADVRRRLGWPAKTTVDWQIEAGRAVVVQMKRNDDLPLVKLVRVNGRLQLPARRKVDRAALAKSVREERDSR